jgi:transposase-like protein
MRLSLRNAEYGLQRLSADHCESTRHTSKSKTSYLCRAVDRGGRTVAFRLSAKREVEAAKGFLRKAIRNQHVRRRQTPWTTMPRLIARCAR